jgi:hypothetical protein
MKTFMTLAVIVSSLAVAMSASAAQPTQADFDACNATARAAGSSPSASPQAGGATGPSITTPSGTPDATSGVQQGGGTGKTGPMITGSGRQSDSTGGVRAGTGAVTKDATGSASTGTATGMATDQNDPAYKTAYQDCMKRRGF